MCDAGGARRRRLTLALVLAPALTWLLLAPRVSSAEPAGERCTVTDPRLTEISGLAADGDRLFVVNDGGTAVEVAELDAGCQVSRLLRGDVDPYDVEDLARAPDGTLWLADVGDNDERRETVALELLSPSGAVTLYRLTYPDGAHDAEALLLDRGGRPYVVTKSAFGSSGVYTPDAELSADRSTPLRKVTTLRFGPTGTDGGPVGTVSQLLVTGGAVSPDGTRVALRTYTDVYLWSAPDGDVEAALRDTDPVEVPLPVAEEQGEAVTFTSDGATLLTVSEGSPARVQLFPVPPVEEGGSGRDDAAARGDSDDRSDAADGAGAEEQDGDGPSTAFNAVLAALVAGAVLAVASRLRRRSD